MDELLSFKIAFARKHLARNTVGGECEEIVVPILDPLNLREIFPGVLLSDDLRASRIQPRVPVGMVEVPVRVYRDALWIGAEIGDSLGHLHTRHADAGVY